MTDIDLQVAALLRSATDDLGSDPALVAAAGLARGRRRRSRRQLGAAVTAAAVVAVLGVGLSLRGGEVRTAVDPVQPAGQPTAAAVPDPTPAPEGPPRPRALAITAAELPSTFTALLPGAVDVPAPKDGETNPMDGFDPRENAATTTFARTEPGPGIYAGLVWDGHPVVVSVAPTEPTHGDTALERCVGGGEGDNGTCVATDDGGAIQTTSFDDPDGGTVRIVNVYTPDLWEVTALNVVDPTGPSLDQLRMVATSDVWFAPR